MRWSLNESVTESSRVQCEVCSEDCQGDRTECKQEGKSSDKNMTSRHLLRVDSFGCLSNHGFNAFTANTVKGESTNHGFIGLSSIAVNRES